MSPDPQQEKSTWSTERMLLLLVALIAVIALSAYIALGRIQDRADSSLANQIARTRAARSVDPYANFTTVRNDCGTCGTDTPVGGWEASDGRILIFDRDGSFTAFFPDESPMTGDWDVVGDRLCLESAFGVGDCFDYEQRIDAMRLDDAIYIRE